MSYIGDFAEDYATLNKKFTTVGSDGASTVLAGSPVISVYKANGTTQSTAGITLSVDFDSVVGLNNVLIDLSADAFYAVGNDYQIVITTGTVGGTSVVGYVVGEFSIENRFMRGTDSALLASTFSTMFSGITALAQWLGLLAGKQAGDATALTEIKASGAGSGTFSELTDSLEAIRDRGDVAWGSGVIKKNTAISGDFTFVMLDTNGDPIDSVSITAEMSIDGAAYTGMTNAVSFISSGTYKISIAAADTNGDSITWKFSGSGAKNRYVSFVTNA